MNLVNWLTGLFRGHNANGELEKVRHAARQDAQLVVGAYVQEFEAEAGRIMLDRQRRFIGHVEAEVIDVKDEGFDGAGRPLPFGRCDDCGRPDSPTHVCDLSGLTRQQLMARAKEQGLPVDARMKKTDLVKAILEGGRS